MHCRNENTDHKIPLGNTFLRAQVGGGEKKGWSVLNEKQNFSAHEAKRIGLNGTES